MRLREVKIGNLKTGNNVFLAPLAGYTNGVFRTVCEKLGAGLTFTEMVSAKGLCYGSEKTEQLLYVSEDYRGIKAAQIFGNDPEYMRRACESDALAKFDLIDINMGCPVSLLPAALFSQSDHPVPPAIRNLSHSSESWADGLIPLKSRQLPLRDLLHSSDS